MFLKKFRTKTAEKNLAVNKKNIEPEGMINGQGELSDYRFGLSTMDKVGCGIIAIYNALRLLGREEGFTELIREFETNSTETIPFGFFGINSFSMTKFFKARSISYTKLHSINDIVRHTEEGGIYIFTFFNNRKKLTEGAHTVALQYSDGFYTVYNLTNGRKEPVSFTDAAEIIGDGLLILGYRLCL